MRIPESQRKENQMNRHVPGNKRKEVAVPERPLEEQTDIMWRKLGAKEVFTRMRGKVAGFPMWEMLDLDSDDSPTASLRKYDRYVSNLRVMRNFVVWLRCNGCRAAAFELLRALEDEEYVMWCEDIPIESSAKVVVAIFNPITTMRLYHWYESDQRYSFTEPTDETGELLAMFPRLREDFFAIIRASIIDPILAQSSAGLGKRFQCMSWTGSNFPLYSRPSNGDVYRESDMRKTYNNGAFAYLFPGCDQGEFLSWLPRKLQDSVATWQMQIPEKKLLGIQYLRFALVPERDHPKWQKLYRSQASPGIAVGMGAIFDPKDELEKSAGTIMLHNR